MGVDIHMWRVKIGLFTMPNKCRTRVRGLKLPRTVIFVGLRWILIMSVVLLNSGDVETNPGPTGQGSRTARQSHASNSVVTRSGQRTLSSSFSLSQPAQRTDVTDVSRPLSASVLNLSQQVESRRQSNATSQPCTSAQQLQHPLSPSGRDSYINIQNTQTSGGMFDFLRQMKTDLTRQNNRMVDELSRVNFKMDSLSESITQLRSENEQLKRENQEIKSELKSMSKQLDMMDGQFRSNNLRIDGIPGTINEKWADSEEKVRNFMKNDLQIENSEDFDIEKSQRVKSRNPNMCSLLVKFTRKRDRDLVLSEARSKLTRDSNFTVRPDYTDRIKRHRRELGTRMLHERRNNNYAAMRHDKLIVNDQIFRYDDATESIVCLGRRQFRRTDVRDLQDLGQAENVDIDQPLTENTEDSRPRSAWGDNNTDFD